MNNLKNKIKAFIFDLDGTIITTENIWQQVTRDYISSKGIPNLTINQINLLQKNSSGGLINFSKLLKTEFKISDSIEQIVNEKTKMFLTYMKKYPINFIDGFENFHKKIQASSITSCIATNSTLKTLETIIPQMSLDKFFGKNIYSMEHVNNKAKPDPSLFLHVAEKLKAKPKECIIFEDSLVGFTAAKKAGMKCIAIKNKANETVLNKADFVINNYHEAEELLKKI